MLEKKVFVTHFRVDPSTEEVYAQQRVEIWEDGKSLGVLESRPVSQNASINFQAESWDSELTYSEGDVVSHRGEKWAATANDVTEEPSETATSWELLPAMSSLQTMVETVKKVMADATKDRIDELSPAERADLMTLYPKWKPGLKVEVDDMVVHSDVLYKCIQSHVTQSSWTPDVVPALWNESVPEGVIGEWVQPTGAHDAYNTGDQVIFEGSVYESSIDANTWSPTEYPAGWTLIS